MEKEVASINYLLSKIMPLTFNGLVVENTNRCNAKCAMCYQSAGPKGSEILGKSTLPIQAIEKIIREAVNIPTLTRRFHLSGGEAFLDIDGCIYLFNTAKESGYYDITTTTNGYWAKKVNRAISIAKLLKIAGLTSAEISWDYWHQPYIDPTAVSNCIEALSDEGIEVNLRLLATKSHSHAESLAFLRDSAINKSNRITCGVVFPTGRAAKEIEKSDFYYNGGTKGNCHSILNLTVNSSGDVFPCCAGIDQTNKIKFGNVNDTSIVEIASNMNSSPLVRSIVFQGISSLVPILSNRGYKIEENQYTNICHLCWTLFSNEAYVDSIKEHYLEESKKAIEVAIDFLETSLKV